MERVDRDSYRYSEGDHTLIVQIEVQSGNPDYIVYAASILSWLPPHENELITQTDSERILQKIGRFIEYYGETFEVK